MNYAPCQMSLVKETEREKRGLKEKKERRTARGGQRQTQCVHGNTKRKEKPLTHTLTVTKAQEDPSHHFCCIWSIGLQPSDSHLLPTSVKETEGRRGGEEEGNLGTKKGKRKREGRGEKRRERDKGWKTKNGMMNIEKIKRRETEKQK